LYVDDILPRLVVLGIVYVQLSVVHHVCLANDMVMVGVKEVQDVDFCISIPIEEV